MSVKKHLKHNLFTSVFGWLFAGLVAATTVTTPLLSTPVYAEPETSETEKAEENTEAQTVEQSEESEIDNTCYDQVGAIGWLICPTTGVIAKAIDAVYGIIEDLLTVKPISQDDSSPIYLVWQILRDVTNIVFVIFLLIVVYSQITGLGINNYGIKKALPKLIIAAVLVNLSFLICSLAVDISNIVGVSLRGVFNSIEESAIASGGLGEAAKVSWVDLVAALAGGGAIAGLAISASGGLGAFLWMLVPVLIGGILAIFVGLITVALRQAVVSMLIMISPLAMVAYLLPNTEQYFKKWKDMLTQMLIFFPMFSLLFGAAQLAGWALIASASSAFGVILGMAVQVFPLFLSISLMKMSGTVLGAVSSKLTGLTAKANAGAGNWANSWREQRKQRYLANSNAPAAGLRRYLDYRAKLREEDLKNSNTIREGKAVIRAQGHILGNQKYDPAFKDQKLKTNSYTRNAKLASAISMDATNATRNTEHVLGEEYGARHAKTRRDQALAEHAEKSFIEMHRTEITAQNDTYADIDYLMGKYDKFWHSKPGTYEYDHYVTGGAGALGHLGEETVLGETIAKAAANEAKRRAYTNYVFSKYGYNKSDARHMHAGYYVDDDGFALDGPNGNRVIGPNGEKERSPGEFLKYHPEYLRAYDVYETAPDGTKLFYYDAHDQDGRFITRIYKKDTPAMKEIFSNWDMPIADPIDGLYGILSGIKEGEYANILDANGVPLEGVGLANLSTTLNRATMSSGFKEKASYAGPMYATSVGQRYIKDFVHLNIARLDNLIKTAKPSGFNTQDQAEFQQLQLLMDPANWDWMLFNEESLKSFRNVNGEHMKGLRFERDADGNLIRKDVAPENATLEDLKNKVIDKYLVPAAPKFATMMSRITNGIIDNQKPGVAENWNKLLNSMEKWNDPEWKEKYPQLNNPFAKQTNDTISKAREISRRIRPDTQRSQDGTSASPELRQRLQEAERRANGGMPYQLTDEDRRVDAEFEAEQARAPWGIDNVPGWMHDPAHSKNYIVRVTDIKNSNVGGMSQDFYNSAMEYLDEIRTEDPRIENVIDAFEEYNLMNRDDATVTVEDYYNYLCECITQCTYE